MPGGPIWHPRWIAARLATPSWVLVPGFLGLSAILGLLAGIDPALAVGVAFAFAFVVLALANLTAGLIAFVLLAFLEFVFPGGSVISVTRVAGLVLVLSWLAKASTSADHRTLLSAHPVALYLLLAFLGWGALSATWAEDPSEAVVDLTRYLSVIALFVITYSAINERRHMRWVLGTFLLGTAVAAGYGLVSRPSGASGEPFRIASTVGDPNVLATVLVAGLALALGASAALRRAPLPRLGAIGVAALCAAAFVLTGSRGGIVSLAAALVVTVLIAGRWRAQAFLGAVTVAAVTALLFAAFAPPEIRDRIAQTTTGETRSDEGRVTLWQVAWRMFEDRPVTGVGLGGFQTSSIRYVDEPGALGRTDQVIDEPEVVHNVYLQSLAEIGIVGTALFLAVLGFSIGCATIAARNFARSGDREMDIMARALVVAVAGFLAAEFFVSEPFNKMLWLLLGLGPAMLAISRTSLGAGGSGRAPGAGAR